MRKFIVLFATVMILTPALSFSAEPEMVMRAYTVQNFAGCSFGKPPSEENTNQSWRELFADLGVQWPEGSSMKYEPSLGKLLIKNTPDNLELLEKILHQFSLIPKQIEIELQFVEYDLSLVEHMLIKNTLNMKTLRDLHAEGKGELIAAPRVISQSGSEATVKGVAEVIYPTEIGVDLPRIDSSSNVTLTIQSGIPVPCGFETRETGALLSVLSEVNAEGNLIMLQMNPEFCTQIGWNTYKTDYTDSAGKKQEASIDQPTFHTINVTSQVMLTPGETALMGGGIPSQNEGKVVYVFVTARFIDLSGNEIKIKK